jgi:hypothetical protein
MQKRYPMKKLLTLLTLALGFNLSASHLLGGFINATQYGLTDTVSIQVTLFSDPQGIPGSSSITLNDLIKTNGFYQNSSTIALTQQSTGSWQGVITTIYSGTVVLPAGEHRLIYTNCCRGMLSNASSAMNSNFTIALDYNKTAANTVTNSAPYILNFLPVKWINGVTSQSMLFAYDVDGDSVSVEMDDAINQHANNTFVPLAPFSQLTSYGSYNVDPNGLIKWKPNTLGQFATGFKVSEYRNGQVIGVSRVQQVFQVENGSTPLIVAPFNMNFNADSTITIQHDLLNGDSAYVGFTGSNYLNAQLVILGTTINKVGNTTWSVTNLNTAGTYRGYLRIYGSNSNMDFPIRLVINSTIGLEENIANYNTQYEVYDWYGRYMGTSLEGLKGLFVIRYSNGKAEKVLCN